MSTRLLDAIIAVRASSARDRRGRLVALLRGPRLAPVRSGLSAGTAAFRGRWFAARVGAALVAANLRYWLTVAPIVRAQLRRWERVAREIGDPVLQALALEKLREEGFNAEVAAILATSAPRERRANAVEAIVALEVAFDYLDGLTEAPSEDPLRDGRDLFRAFSDALAPSREAEGDYYRLHPRSEDRYLGELVSSVRTALGALPGFGATAGALAKCAARAGEAQVRAHAVARDGTAGAQQWATAEAADTALGWREFLAGAAASVLAAHALVAAAADPRTTPERAAQIDEIYLPISVMPTLLDSAIDHELDMRADGQGFTRWYDDPHDLAGGLSGVVDHVMTRARTLPNGARHAMILVGVVAYYSSDPRADNEFARPVFAALHHRLRGYIGPALTVMRAWRALKRVRSGGRGRRSRA
jgi:tetraprenyl-beta-curcumene synthase